MIKVGLKELEKRLRDEPDNIGLRVTVAGGLREAGRLAEAVELYRSVAIAYRDQGRTLQAIAVCRSILEIAPLDPRCKELLGALEAPQAAPLPAIPVNSSKQPLSAAPIHPPKRDPLDDAPRRPVVVISRPEVDDETPLPIPMPYHVADPTQSIAKVSERASSELDTDPRTRALPVRDSDPASSSSMDLDVSTEVVARISAAELAELAVPTMKMARLEVIDEPEKPHVPTLQMPRMVEAVDDLDKLAAPTMKMARLEVIDDLEADDGPFMASATTPVPRFDVDDDPPLLPPIRAGSPLVVVDGIPTDTEDELTVPRDLPSGTARRVVDPLSTSFFAPIPVERRAIALSRFHRRAPAPNHVLIKKGETNHPFVIVLEGGLEIRSDHAPPYTIGPGTHVGEASLLTRGPSAITVVTASDSKILVLQPADFYEIVGGFPAVWAALKAPRGR